LNVHWKRGHTSSRRRPGGLAELHKYKGSERVGFQLTGDLYTRDSQFILWLKKLKHDSCTPYLCYHVCK
jgi:hypothetical protein